MIGISWTEMLVVGVFALIFIGPKELPVVMGRLGKMIGAIRRMGGEFQRELNKATGLNAVTDIRRSITEPLKKTTAEIAREFNSMTSTGVEPSGALKPADPKKESVVDEIRAQAGMAPAAEPPAVTTPPPPPTPAQAVASKSKGPVVAEPAKTGAAKPTRARKTAASANGARAPNGAAKPAGARRVTKTTAGLEQGAETPAKPPRKRRAAAAKAPADPTGPANGTG
jgi:sec-independent protein translocase protein TatB